MNTVPRLACEQCKGRKIRCNKGSPCSACKNAGINCHTVQRARLPRGKSSKPHKQNNKLEDRVARIESLLAQQADVSGASCSATSSESVRKVETNTILGFAELTTSEPTLGTRLAHLVAPDFWNTLSEEIHGLREMLESSEDEAEGEKQANVSMLNDSTAMSNTGVILFPLVNGNLTTGLPILTSDSQSKLLELYQHRVDSVYKILHWPSVLRMINKCDGYENERYSEMPEAILEAAIYFMAICSMTDSESVELGFGIRHEVLQEYRSIVEYNLAQSSLLHCPNLITLQAFVIYLVRILVRELAFETRMF
jgi:hypothetical protein